MNWTDIFPVLSDELLDAYRAGVTEEERAQYEEWLGVQRIYKCGGARPGARSCTPLHFAEGSAANEAECNSTVRQRAHVVSATLFWKHVMGVDIEYVTWANRRSEIVHF